MGATWTPAEQWRVFAGAAIAFVGFIPFVQLLLAGVQGGDWSWWIVPALVVYLLGTSLAMRPVRAHLQRAQRP